MEILFVLIIIIVIIGAICESIGKKVKVKNAKFKEEKGAYLTFDTILNYKQSNTCVLMARIGELQSNPLTYSMGGFNWSELFSKSYPSDYVFIAEYSPKEKVIVKRNICRVYLNIDEKAQSLLDESNGFYLR